MTRAGLRSVLIPLGVAAALFAAAWIGGFEPLTGAIGNVANAITGRTPIRQGFIGMSDFGDWRLICVPGPNAGVPAPGTDEAQAAKTNSCRLNQEVAAPEEPSRILLAANLSVVGPQEKPALLLRLPGTFKAGDSIALRIDQDLAVRTAVRDCTPSECVAASDLSDDNWTRLVGAESLQIMFRMRDGKMVFLNLGTSGLGDAAAALRSAQVSAR
jgi:invasion protein IalB